MKRIIRLYCALFIALFTNAFSADQKPWYMSVIKHMNSKYYTNNCLAISTGQMVRKIAFCAHTFIKRTTISPEKQLQEIETQLQNFKIKLLDKEQKALLAIKKKYHINQKQWDKIMASIAQLKTMHNNALSQECQDYSLDTQLPQHLIILIKNLCKKNNIHPTNISLKLMEKPYKNTIAQAISTVYFYSGSADCELRYTPHKIEFFQNALKQSEEELVATCAHELEHIIQQHCIVRTIISEFLKYTTHLSKKEIEASNEYQTLIHIQEQQAEIFPALKDPYIAECFTYKRARGYYPKYLYEKHYYHLTTIHMLWQLRAWIQFLHKN